MPIKIYGDKKPEGSDLMLLSIYNPEIRFEETPLKIKAGATLASLLLLTLPNAIADSDINPICDGLGKYLDKFDAPVQKDYKTLIEESDLGVVDREGLSNLILIRDSVKDENGTEIGAVYRTYEDSYGTGSAILLKSVLDVPEDMADDYRDLPEHATIYSDSDGCIYGVQIDDTDFRPNNSLFVCIENNVTTVLLGFDRVIYMNSTFPASLLRG